MDKVNVKFINKKLLTHCPLCQGLVTDNEFLLKPL